jgi:hypothetical protein
MSGSERRSEGKGRLVVEAPLGVEILIADGGFSVVEKAVTRFDGELDGGVYSVRWIAADRSRQWIIRVKAGATATVDEDTPGSNDSGWDMSRFASAAHQLLSTPPPNAHAGILVAVLAPKGEIRADIFRSIRLRDADGEPPHPLGGRGIASIPEGWQALAYAAHSGAYTISYETFERRRVQQSVYLPQGRWTMLLLSYGHGKVVEKANSDVQVRSRRGINPAATTIFSCPFGSSEEEAVNHLRTAEILLHHLRRRAQPFDIGVAEELGRRNSDPFLQLYGAAAALALTGAPLDRLTSVLIDGDQDSDRELEAARRIRDNLGRYGDWFDVRALSWRTDGSDSANDAPARQLPMLEISWRWAAAHSATGAGTPQLERSLSDEAARADLSASPWLVTVPAGASRPEAEPVSPEAADVLLQDLSDSLAHAYALRSEKPSRGRADFEEEPSIDLSSLSAQSELIVRTMVAAGGAERWLSAKGRTLHHLAASMGKLASDLAPALWRATQEMGEVIEREQTGGWDVWNTDPNKGAFGGSPQCGGAVLTLESFEEQKGIDFLVLHFAVSGSPDEGLEGPVTFHLHPTFPSSVQQVRVVDGRARLRCYAWGGFTLGAETSDGRRMELDLADLLQLPSWFRAR